ncbi:MAG: hypothetical protein JW827_10525 [Spirochaetes bacterium]|nr:hypothetical protein [Spirochaetota bacterium]
MKNIFIIIVSIIIIILLFLIGAHMIGFVWSTEEIFKSSQPKGISYQSYDPYSLYIYKQKRTFSTEYIIMVSKDVEPSYGHVINHPDPYVISDAELKKTKVTWTPSGIQLVLYLNHKLFIPRKAFVGGR